MSISCSANGAIAGIHGKDSSWLFHFPRHILCSKHEYIMENVTMCGIKSTEGEFDFHLDPDRVRTDAEVDTFAKVFDISVEEARRILISSGRKIKSNTSV